MKEFEKRAWEMLNETERNSLMLTLSNGMSSWEAGGVLGISHYKYLEIKERAERFFKMFTLFFQKNNSTSLFGPETVVKPRFRDYIEGCLEKRLSKAEAVLYPGDSAHVVCSIRREFILKNMALLKASKYPHDIEVYKLIMEFDRWNNWRILPRKIQMPSAYKRRNNKRDKVYINWITKLSSNRAAAMLDIFSYHPKKAFKSRLFITVFSNELFDDGYTVISIRDNDYNREKLNKLYTYMFPDEGSADAFGFLSTRFREKTEKSALGQKFWPKYREVVEKAINYKEVNNINFYVGKLEMAYCDLMGKPSRPKKDKLALQSSPAKRAAKKIFN